MAPLAMITAIWLFLRMPSLPPRAIAQRANPLSLLKMRQTIMAGAAIGGWVFDHLGWDATFTTSVVCLFLSSTMAIWTFFDASRRG